MLSLTIECEDITIKDIDKSQLLKITEWFNGECNYQNRYAMGIDGTITIDDLNEKYLEVLINAQEFFLGINIKGSFIGFIRGRADYRNEGEVWIMSLLIDTSFQNRGIGKRVLNLIIKEFNEKLGIRKFFVCLVDDNERAKVFWQNNGFSEYRSTKNYFTINNKNCDLIILQR